MDKVITEILELIESNGFEAYVVGGYVRDFLLQISSTDVDICTNAKVVDLMSILADYQPVSGNYGAVKLFYKGYKIDLTTYRKDIKYEGNRRNLEVVYVNNLVTDLERRDFTCNTLCMSRSGQIIDLLDGKQDIEDKVIRCVGDIEKKMSEDPLRILRAIRLATCLNFKIEQNLYDFIKNNKQLVSNLSRNRIKEELDKILINKNVNKGLDYLRRLGLLEVIGIDFTKIVYVFDLCGMYSQLTLLREFPFSKEERGHIKDIQKVCASGKIDKMTLFNYGLYVCSVAGTIMGISKEEIAKMDKNMEIKSIKDIQISSDEICDILHIEPSKAIGDVYSILKDLILDGQLINDNEQLKKHLEIQGKKWLNEGKFKKNFTF